jgi:hypothetical protein
MDQSLLNSACFPSATTPLSGSGCISMDHLNDGEAPCGEEDIAMYDASTQNTTNLPEQGLTQYQDSIADPLFSQDENQATISSRLRDRRVLKGPSISKKSRRITKPKEKHYVARVVQHNEDSASTYDSTAVPKIRIKKNGRPFKNKTERKEGKEDHVVEKKGIFREYKEMCAKKFYEYLTFCIDG